MSLRTKLFSASLALGLFGALNGTGLAQQQDPANGQTPGIDASQRPVGRGEGRGFGRGHRQGAFGPKLMEELNLTDEQKQQIRTIIEQSMESSRAQREELRQFGGKRSQGTLTAEDQARAKMLHEQMRASMKETHAKIETILTADQRTRLEELRKERKANHERFGNRRGGFRSQSDQDKPAQKPVILNG